MDIDYASVQKDARERWQRVGIPPDPIYGRYVRCSLCGRRHNIVHSLAADLHLRLLESVHLAHAVAAASEPPHEP